jgi:hypothetical protein
MKSGGCGICRRPSENGQASPLHHCLFPPESSRIFFSNAQEGILLLSGAKNQTTSPSRIILDPRSAAFNRGPSTPNAHVPMRPITLFPMPLMANQSVIALRTAALSVQSLMFFFLSLARGASDGKCFIINATEIQILAPATTFFSLAYRVSLDRIHTGHPIHSQRPFFSGPLRSAGHGCHDVWVTADG